MPFNTSSLLPLLVSLVLFCLPVFFCVVFFRFNAFLLFCFSASLILIQLLPSSFLFSRIYPLLFPLSLYPLSSLPPLLISLPLLSPFLHFHPILPFHSSPFPHILPSIISPLPLHPPFLSSPPLLICPLPLISHPPTVLSPPLPPSPILPQYKTSNTSKQSWTELQPSPASQSQATSVSL